MKRGVVVFTDVSARRIGPIFKGRAVQERRCLLHRDGILKWKKKLLEFYGPWICIIPEQGPNTSLYSEPDYSVSHSPTLL